MVSKKKILDKTYTLFEERVGICYISLGLDTRHPKGEKDEAFPLCARFTIETGPLTIDRIKTALTGRSESSFFIGVWEEIIAEKR